MTIRLIAYAVVFAVSTAAGVFLTRPADAAALHTNSTVKVTQVHYQYGTPNWRYAPPLRAYPRGYFSPRAYNRRHSLPYRYWRWQHFRDQHHRGFRDRTSYMERGRDRDRDYDRDDWRDHAGPRSGNHYDDNHNRDHNRQHDGRGRH